MPDDKVANAVNRTVQREPFVFVTLVLLPDGNILVNGPIHNISLMAEIFAKAQAQLDELHNRPRLIVPTLIPPNNARSS